MKIRASPSLISAWLSSAFPPLWLEFGVERGEAVLPEAAVVIEPGVQILERARVEGVEPLLTLGACADESLVPQDAEVPRDARPCRREVRRDLARAELAFGEQFDDPAPSRVCEGGE